MKSTLAIELLRATQLTVGMREVEERSAKLSDMSRRQLREYLESRPVPIVIGPEGDNYMVDRHHLSLAAAWAGVRAMPTLTIDDWSELSHTVFWSRMKRMGRVYLFERGEGPHDPDQLPTDVRQLSDDPYRSLAWKVRKRGGYRKVDLPFTDFRWADFFRERVELDDFERALDEAWLYARSNEASHLPGYVGYERCRAAWG